MDDAKPFVFKKFDSKDFTSEGLALPNRVPEMPTNTRPFKPEPVQFTVAEYAKALSKLPMHYLCGEYTDLKHIVFDGKIIVAHSDHPPMIFDDGVWTPMSISSSEGMAFYDPGQ